MPFCIRTNGPSGYIPCEVTPSTKFGREAGSGKISVLISSSTPIPFCSINIVESLVNLSLIGRRAAIVWCAFVVMIKLAILLWGGGSGVAPVFGLTRASRGVFAATTVFGGAVSSTS